MSSASTIPLARPTVVPPGDIIFFISISYLTFLTFCKTSPVNFTVPTPRALPLPGFPNQPKKNLWFFDCHFKEDPVMPGCLGLDAMWQLVGCFLGWLGNPGKGRALGVGTVKFTGEVLQNVKNVRYEIDMKKIMSPGGTTVGLANGVVLADDKKIYSADSLKVGLFK